jgi:outer membrane protein OmpA-like peptidoglycan-associated protein
VSPSISNSVSPTTSVETVSELVRSDTNVFFAPDSSRLTAAARSALGNLADSHLDARSGFFVVEGFSVRSGNLGYARALAWRRAQVVADYLRSIGVRAFFRVTARVVDSADSGFRRVEVSATSRQ